MNIVGNICLSSTIFSNSKALQDFTGINIAKTETVNGKFFAFLLRWWYIVYKNLNSFVKNSFTKIEYNVATVRKIYTSLNTWNDSTRSRQEVKCDKNMQNL